MDTQTAFNILLGAVGVGVTWWVNNVWTMVRSQQQQISQLNIELVKNYVPRAELQATFDRIFGLLEEIRKEVRQHQA